MTDELKLFLLQSNRSGYGSDKANEENLPNGENVIHFAQGDYEFKDIYYGGEPYAGQAVIFARGRAVWAMQYRGNITDGEDFTPIYNFLGKVLTGTKVGLPRGVDGTRDGNFLYSFSMDGDLNNFTAHEKILLDDKTVYAARFFGGLVDLRREN